MKSILVVLVLVSSAVTAGKALTADAAEDGPTDGACRLLLRGGPFDLVEEVRSGATPDGAPGCRGRQRRAWVQAETVRDGAVWTLGRIWVEGLLAAGAEEVRALVDAALVRRINSLQELPVTSAWTAFPPFSVQVRLSKEGHIRMTEGYTPAMLLLDGADIEELATAALGNDPEVPFELEADRNLTFAAVSEALRALQRVGVEGVGLRTVSQAAPASEGSLLSSIGGLWLPLGATSETPPAAQDPVLGILQVGPSQPTDGRPGRATQIRPDSTETYGAFIEALDRMVDTGDVKHPPFILVFALPPEEEGPPEKPHLEAAEAGVLEFGPGMQPPVPLHQSAPDYTAIARMARVQGTVLIRAIIDWQGFVLEAEVVEGLPMGLSQKALEAVKTWRFEPATLDGETVAVYYELTVEFKLE